MYANYDLGANGDQILDERGQFPLLRNLRTCRQFRSHLDFMPAQNAHGFQPTFDRCQLDRHDFSTV